MSNNYRVVRTRLYADQDSDESECVADDVLPLSEVIEQLVGQYPRQVVNAATGDSVRVESADDLDGTELVEGGWQPSWDDGRTYCDRLEIRAEDGTPLSPRELFALLVQSDVVML